MIWTIWKIVKFSSLTAVYSDVFEIFKNIDATSRSYNNTIGSARSILQVGSPWAPYSVPWVSSLWVSLTHSQLTFPIDCTEQGLLVFRGEFIKERAPPAALVQKHHGAWPSHLHRAFVPSCALPRPRFSARVSQKLFLFGFQLVYICNHVCALARAPLFFVCCTSLYTSLWPNSESLFLSTIWAKSTETC